ncbi:hypothetical protein [Papillibacter cinnamivorans]|uniref:Uncharacterized protein n=1 Tax=Papillibacter cinnamivorans DSM 12816 TaxID=1122930 RepID=A0A1W1ZLA6_9FIRM|nr:hypothetical protein [Papillibacter cinnamivorans]SMC49196.1 hypothetical protein SAMN02745168_1220 [Papillibacter cinnamivorans DSM 12816]
MRKRGKYSFCLAMLGSAMLLFALGFVWYALNHPEQSFPGGNAAAYPVYAAYLAIMTASFILAAVFRRRTGDRAE